MGSLAQVLRDLPPSADPNLLVNSQGFDDAGVYRVRDDLALVQTVDFFPPLVDDAEAFGRIAAANSLSDVYAMGGLPLTCLNIVAFPDDRLPLSLLGDILRGGAAVVQQADAVIAGGHSVRDSEIKYGLAVTGVVHPQHIITNSGAQAGDRLILTKPIGSGNLTTAFKKGQLSETELQPCITIMSTLNRAAAQAMIEVGVHAATDITGFGLIGHAHEVAVASAVTITLHAAAVPLMDHTWDMARKKMFTRAAAANLECVGPDLDPGGVDELRVKVLAEAQTSGGLLVSVAADRADLLVQALERHGVTVACVIGEVGAHSDRTIVLR